MPIRYQEAQPLFSLRPVKGITIKCYATGTDHRGAETYRAEVRHNGRTIFDDLTGAFSPLHASDGREAREHILSHAAMKPGDTDAEFFDSYTPEQIAFVEAFGDELSAVASYRYGTD